MRILGRIVGTLIVLAIIAVLLLLYLNQKDGFDTPIEEIWSDIQDLKIQTEDTVSDVMDKIKKPASSPEIPEETDPPQDENDRQ